MSSPNVKKALQQYWSQGFVVFPIQVDWNKETGKKRVIPPTGWSTFTLETVKKVLVGTKRNGIALLCGEVSHIFVLDIDDVAGWERYLRESERMEPDTVKQRSQSGGRHLFFRWHVRLASLPSKNQNVIPGLKIDYRTTKDMIIVEPTQLTATRCYEFEPSMSLLNREMLKDMPDWLYKELSTTSKKHITPPVTGGSSGEIDKQYTTYMIPRLLVEDLRKRGFHESVLKTLLYQAESETFVIRTIVKMCYFVGREHKSNCQYLVITAKEELHRRCHDGECKGKTESMGKIPKRVVAELDILRRPCETEDTGNDGEVTEFDEEIVRLAEYEAKQNIMENFDGNDDMTVAHVRSSGTIEGDMVMYSFATGGKCKLCGNS